jgi:hypothetical protein
MSRPEFRITNLHGPTRDDARQSRVYGAAALFMFLIQILAED